MACLLCKTDDEQLVSTADRKGKPLETCVCSGCGQVFNRPIPSDAELARFYAVDYRKQYKGSFRPRGRQIIRNFRRVASHIDRFADIFAKPKTVLDVGAGSGEFVFAMQHLGKDARGIEPNKEYAAYCRSDLSVDVATMEILQAQFDAEQFDLINLSHVLEHLNDPVRYLTLLSTWLKDDGLLYVEVPDIFSYAKRKSKGHMFHYGHIFNFSPWTLRAAAALCGLEECAQTADRCADTTGVFFQKAAKKSSATDAINRGNAETVLAVVTAHNRDGASVYRKNKFLRKNMLRVEETLSSLRLGTPAAIGAAMLKDVR